MQLKCTNGHFQIIIVVIDDIIIMTDNFQALRHIAHETEFDCIFQEFKNT